MRRLGTDGLMLVFTGFLSVTGAATSAADALSTQLTRTAIATAVPVVGSIISDAAGTVLAGAGMLKGAIGVFGLLAVLAICLTPLSPWPCSTCCISWRRFWRAP